MGNDDRKQADAHYDKSSHTMKQQCVTHIGSGLLGGVEIRSHLQNIDSERSEEGGKVFYDAGQGSGETLWYI